jgi:predicted O-methyltransferase YrrM
MTIKKIIEVLKRDGFKSFISKSVLLFKRWIFLNSPNKLKILFSEKISKFQPNNINEVVDYCFYALGGVIRPIQIREEFYKFLETFKNKAPKIVLEIGTASGGSLFSLCKLAPEDATIMSIDLPEGKFGGGYPEWKTPIYKFFKKKKQKLFLLREDSHLEQTVKKIKEILNDKKIDFLFIDGDHSYEGVKKDFEMYSPLVNKNGVIAFHDVTPGGLECFTGGVPRFWKEIKNKYTYKEFIQDEKQTGYGIGCLFLN